MPQKLCECGCGGAPPIAKWTNRKRGYKAGQQIRFINGHNGRVRDAEANERIRKARLGTPRPEISGEKHPSWRGELTSYTEKHRYLSKHRKKTGFCSICLNFVGAQKGGTDWANLSGEYKREFEDWSEMCRKCHYWYDHRRSNTAEAA